MNSLVHRSQDERCIFLLVQRTNKLPNISSQFRLPPSARSGAAAAFCMRGRRSVTGIDANRLRVSCSAEEREGVEGRSEGRGSRAGEELGRSRDEEWGGGGGALLGLRQVLQTHPK